MLRYLYIGYGVIPYKGNGQDIVNNYIGSALVKINDGTVGQAPQPGDVLSYVKNTPDGFGHTSLVISSNVNSSGNGNVTVLEQNDNNNGTDTLTVSNWDVYNSWAHITNWLHDPSSGGSSTATPLAGHWVSGMTSDGIGFYDPSTQRFYLRNSQSAGYADETILFGNPGDLPVVGDWNGTGIDTIGVYQPGTANFALTTSNTPGTTATYSFMFGNPNSGWIPIVGDWTGLGHDGVGLYDPSTATFYLRNSLTAGAADITIRFGDPGDLPIVGRLAGGTFDSIGVYNPSTAQFFLAASNAPGTIAALGFTYGNANSGWIPFIGSWTSAETDGPALYNHAAATFYLRYTLTGGVADNTFLYGNPN